MRDSLTKRELLWWVGSASVSLALLALFTSYLLGDHFTDIVAIGVFPILIGVLIFFVVAAVRLRVFGHVTGDIGPFVPASVWPAFRWWITIRLGFFGAVLLLVAITLASAIAGVEIAIAFRSIVYVVLTDIMTKLVFGTALNCFLLSHSWLSRDSR